MAREPEDLREGRAAIARGDWGAARARFEGAVRLEASAEALEGLAEALFFHCDYPAAIESRVRAYAEHRRRGNDRAAALAAGWVASVHGLALGNEAPMNGWLQRARTLIAGEGDCPERGRIALLCAVFAEDHEERARHLEQATSIARRFGDTDLELDALAYFGGLLVERGEVEEGMRLLDEAAAAATGGDVRDPVVIGEIYCNLLSACEMSLDVRRAEQWLRVIDGFVEKTRFLPASAICRMHYGGILVAAGRWKEAEQELIDSARLYDESFVGMRAGAVVRLADLRVRQGRLEEAARLLEDHEHDPHAIQPIARLHLARGDVGPAEAALDAHLARHGTGALQGPNVALLAEVKLAAGKLEEARAAAERLLDLAERTGGPLLRGLAELAAGRVGRAVEEPAAAQHLHAAIAAFLDAGLPLEVARARLELARAVAATNRQLAMSEGRAALEGFESLAAGREADETARFLREVGDRRRRSPRWTGPLTKRETEVLGLIGEGLSNTEIAERLFISKRTVEHHVSRVLSKLGLASRPEAVAYALRRRAR